MSPNIKVSIDPKKTTRHSKHTSVGFLVHQSLDLAFVGLGHVLLSNRPTSIVETFRLVHGALERIALPAEEVILTSS